MFFVGRGWISSVSLNTGLFHFYKYYAFVHVFILFFVIFYFLISNYDFYVVKYLSHLSTIVLVEIFYNKTLYCIEDLRAKHVFDFYGNLDLDESVSCNEVPVDTIAQTTMLYCCNILDKWALLGNKIDWLWLRTSTTKATVPFFISAPNITNFATLQAL